MKNIIIVALALSCNLSNASFPCDRSTLIAATGVTLGVGGMAIAAWGYNNNVKNDEFVRKVYKENSEGWHKELQISQSNKSILKIFGKCCGAITLSSVGLYFWSRSKK